MNLGHQTVHVPLIELRATEAPKPSRDPSAALVTSKAVVRFVPEIDALLSGVRTAAVGHATAEALEQAGVRVHIVGDGGGVEALERLQVGPEDVAWFVGAKEPAGPLMDAIQRRGLHQWGVYTNAVPDGAPELLRAAVFDAVVFSSSSAVRAFASILGGTDCPVFVIGSTTAAEARLAGFDVVTVASHHSLEALAQSTAFLAR